MKFSDYIQKQGDEFRRAGDGYEALRDTSKACIDSAVQRYIDEHASKQQCIAFADWLKNNTIGFNMKYTTQHLYNQFIEQQNK